MEPTQPKADEQLAQSAWVRRLAQNILHDPALAEDAAQESAIAAWRHGPIASHARASWLATTVRRLAGRLLRGETRRSARERAAARDEALPSTAELVERAEAHRALVAAVLALEEPYRSTVLLRYVEDLPPRAIARRAGVPVATVKTRLARGLERLRKQLEREHGDAREWVGLLVPLAHFPHTSPLILGTTLVKTLKITAAALLVLLLTVGLWHVLRPDHDLDLPALPASAPSAANARPATPAVEAGAGEHERVGLEGQRLAAAAVDAKTLPEREPLHGRVLDLAEQPIAGAHIRGLHSPSDGFEIFASALEEPAREIASTESAEEGRFTLEIPYGMLVALEVSKTGFAIEQLEPKSGSTEIVVHLGACAVLTGEVTRAADGSPVVGALVRIEAGSEGGIERLVRTDAFGRYRCEDLVPGRIGLIVAPLQDALTRYEELALKPGETRQHDLQVASGVKLHGRVLDERTRAPIQGAEVSGWDFVYYSTRSDAHGEFDLAGVPPRPLTLSARASGFGRTDQRVLEPGAEIEVLLRAGRRARGRVLGPDGHGLAGAFVAALAGDSTGDFASGTNAKDERAARSDEEGRFEITDLRADLSHVLLVRASGFGAVFRSFPAGEAQSPLVELGDLVLAGGATLEGRVLDAGGKPCAGVSVAVLAVHAEPSLQMLTQLHGRRDIRSEENGRFVFRDLAPGDWTLKLQGHGLPSHADVSLHLAPGEFRNGLELWLGEGVAIEGRVGDEHGDPIADVCVTATSEDEARPGAGFGLTDESGHFRVTGLQPGSFALEVRAPNGDGRALARFERFRQPGIVAGHAPIDIRLVPRSSSIRGRVLDAEGRPVAGAFVWRLEEPFPPQEFVLSEADGRFEIGVGARESVRLHAQRGIDPTAALRAPTGAEVFARRVVVDEVASRAFSAELSPGSTEVELRLRVPR